MMINDIKRTDVLTQEMLDGLIEDMEYTRLSFINQAVEMLQILKIRIDRGDKITDEVSHVVYDPDSFREFIEKNFSEYICSQIYDHPRKAQKAYFSLEECAGGYQLVLAEDGKNKTYEWISSLSERFSLVEMIATGVVYVKNIKMGTYTPFISSQGKYCRYSRDEGKIIEI